MCLNCQYVKISIGSHQGKVLIICPFCKDILSYLKDSNKKCDNFIENIIWYPPAGIRGNKNE